MEFSKLVTNYVLRKRLIERVKSRYYAVTDLIETLAETKLNKPWGYFHSTHIEYDEEKRCFHVSLTSNCGGETYYEHEYVTEEDVKLGVEGIKKRIEDNAKKEANKEKQNELKELNRLKRKYENT